MAQAQRFTARNNDTDETVIANVTESMVLIAKNKADGLEVGTTRLGTIAAFLAFLSATDRTELKRIVGTDLATIENSTNQWLIDWSIDSDTPEVDGEPEGFTLAPSS